MFENRFHEFIHRGREIRGRLVVRAVTCSRSEKSIALPACTRVCVCARMSRLLSREEDECILITRSLPMTPGNRVYVASVSTRHCVLYVHPRSSTRTHVEKIIGTVYANERATIVRIYTRERKKIVKMNRLVSNRISFVLATGR